MLKIQASFTMRDNVHVCRTNHSAKSDLGRECGNGHCDEIKW